MAETISGKTPLPHEFRLPTVDSATIAEFDAHPSDPAERLARLSMTNPDFVDRLRRAATELFPHDLAARELAVQLTTGMVDLFDRQALKEGVAATFDV